jgi:hypothetical protein
MSRAASRAEADRTIVLALPEHLAYSEGAYDAQVGEFARHL